MFPMQRKVLTDNPVTIEYDYRGKRVTKELPNSYAARAFYKTMHNANRNPKVINTKEDNRAD